MPLSLSGHLRVASLLLGVLGTVSIAQASGPTERMVQLLANPSNPDALVVRYGVATHGFLFSKDGGKSFRAMCSQAIMPDQKGEDRLNKISQRTVASTAATAIDVDGRLMFSQYGSFYTDDGTGCAWTRVPEFEQRWALGLQTDPQDPSVVWAAVSDAEQEVDPSATSTVDLMRRDASGAWSVVGPITSIPAGQLAYDGNLVASAFEGKTRLYLTMNVGGIGGYRQHDYVSEDGGKTWQDFELPPELDSLNLLAVDPQNPDRVLAALSRDAEADQLLISEDKGRTFKPYTDALRAVSGVAFDPDGRMYVSDAGDASSSETVGGLFVARKLGEPLEHIDGTEYIDCVQRHAQTGKLYVCSADRFGTADPQTGAFSELIRLETVSEMLSCPGRDLVEECKEQLNEGPSWCCAGHFPFTPLCGAYDVTRLPDGRRVFCGLSGREYDRPRGDAGVPSAGASDASTPALPLEEPSGSGKSPSVSAPQADSGGGGCALAGSERGSFGGALFGIGFLLMAVRRARRRR
jgi:hypothetical protein